MIFGKVLNSNWAIRSDSNLSVALLALEMFNSSLLTNKNWWNINNTFLSDDSIDLYKFDAAMIAGGADHGLVLHNRKFYFNFYDNNFLPIYYDGMPDFSKNLSKKDLTNKINLDIKLYEHDSEKTKTYIDLDNLTKGADLLLSQIEIDSYDFFKILEKNNLFVDLNYVDDTLKKIINNLNYISNLNTSDENKKFSEIQNSLDTNNLKNSITNLRQIYDEVPLNFISINQDNLSVKSCEYDLTSCENLQYRKELVKNLFDDEFGENRSIVLGSSLDKFSDKLYENPKKIPKKIKNAEIYLKGDSHVEFDQINSILNVFIGDKGNVLITSNNEPILFDVKLTRISESFSNEFFEDIFTGCLNFYEVKFLNNLIYSENQNCEDSVNIINSSGTINKIEILNSFSDGLDVDFSSLNIETLLINNAGNDCADFSYGIYTIIDMEIANCNDKGLSIGEFSSFVLSNLSINNAFSGIAVKDSSLLIANDLRIEDVNYCLTTYRKKQEFAGGEIKYNKIHCPDNNYFVQKGSTIDKDDHQKLPSA